MNVLFYVLAKFLEDFVVVYVKSSNNCVIHTYILPSEITYYISTSSHNTVQKTNETTFINNQKNYFPSWLDPRNSNVVSKVNTSIEKSKVDTFFNVEGPSFQKLHSYSEQFVIKYYGWGFSQFYTWYTI